jgi:hypothetical protein
MAVGKCFTDFHFVTYKLNSVVGWGIMLQAGRSWVWFLMRSLNFFNLPNTSNRTLTLGLTQPLT